MTITGTVYVGTDGTTTVQFTNAAGDAEDPDIVTLSFSLASGLPYTVWTYDGFGSITKLGIGNYSAVISTTGASQSSNPRLTCVWRGTGGLGAVGEGSVVLKNPSA